MSDHYIDLPEGALSCCVCGVPLSEEEAHIIHNFNDEGDAVFCNLHYEKANGRDGDD